MVAPFDMSYVLHGLFNDLSKNVGTVVVVTVFASIVLLELVQYLQEKRRTRYIFDSFPWQARYGWYYLQAIALILFGYFGAQTFIYFQF